MIDNLAVCVRNVTKCYGPNQILKGICVSVERGTIYGLLGPSGCGKTTLLNSIVGRTNIDGGDMWILGRTAEGSPGPLVGYMPQNTALTKKFTVKEIIYFFGTVLGMDPFVLEKRFHSLKEMLDLPSEDRLIENCSGGQQRRISLAVALVHEPELLILDEPSVGADPILRERIWTYLYELVGEGRATVILTTHYIEEARQANRVGLMRNGKLLIEDSPNKLLKKFNCATLEDLFFILSDRDEKHKVAPDLGNGNDGNQILPNGNWDYYPSTEKIQTLQPYKEKRHKGIRSEYLSPYRLKALLIKNFIQIKRSHIVTSIIVLTPFIQMTLFLLAVGGEVKDTPIAVINDEAAPCLHMHLSDTVEFLGNECHLHNISCRFIQYLNHPMMDIKIYNSVSKALEDVRRGKLKGAIHISPNLSENVEDRLRHGLDLSATKQAEIDVYLDMADLHIGGSLRTKLYYLYVDFQTSIFKACKMALEEHPPLNVKEYYYGHRDDSNTAFLAPGIMVLVIFFLGVRMTAAIIVDEKTEGIWDRTIVAGITTLELTIAHFTVEICMLCLMTIGMMMAVFVIHGHDHVGSIWTIFTFTLFEGVSGLVFGFWVSVVSRNHTAANIIVTGIMNPLTMISGVFWPLESMPDAIQLISKCLPVTIPIIALRNIVKKGWELSKEESLLAISITVAWMCLIGSISLYLIKIKR